ncbi:aminopeptidase [Conexibacter sp. W3-3-2]|uniref:aminopeptidase n=1 Tax=Conexibacter sp. W3-3-2 TaxID=2675227 RepID=UPI001E4C4E18|nr:aminopeptidase [Conexibacter sp. W3-3-2]
MSTDQHPGASGGMDEATLARFADLVVGFGANVQPEQIVAIGAEIGKEHLARALAASAYRAGAKFVDVQYFDLHVKRARVEFSREELLPFVPSWYGERILELGRQRCARIGLTGPSAPGLLDDLDPARVGKDPLPFLKESGQVVNERTTNWTAVPCPTPQWAQLVHPELDPVAAYAKLCEQIVHVCRLDEEDPIAAWTARADALVSTAARMTGIGYDALHFTGPGTDLTVGLLPTSTWMAARFETVDGITHMPNLPSEEIFTAPDPLRVDGVVRSTKPLVVGGSIIRGLEVEFRDGRAVRIDADEHADVLRGYAARDEGAARLGEVALVDGDGRIGALDTVFFDTLLDENAASHIAIGSAYQFTAGEADHPRLNQSQIHIDFMIGGPDVDVHATPRGGGDRVPVLVGGAWKI